uniref:Uncharacterized protein n=1 Tax=Anguilla anguilla TaxID=7936 RepID=A0A0E9THQ2_ANGAN
MPTFGRKEYNDFSPQTEVP